MKLYNFKQKRSFGHMGMLSFLKSFKSISIFMLVSLLASCSGGGNQSKRMNDTYNFNPQGRDYDYTEKEGHPLYDGRISVQHSIPTHNTTVDPINTRNNNSDNILPTTTSIADNPFGIIRVEPIDQDDEDQKDYEVNLNKYEIDGGELERHPFPELYSLLMRDNITTPVDTSSNMFLHEISDLIKKYYARIDVEKFDNSPNKKKQEVYKILKDGPENEIKKIEDKFFKTLLSYYNSKGHRKFFDKPISKCISKQLDIKNLLKGVIQEMGNNYFENPKDIVLSKYIIYKYIRYFEQLKSSEIHTDNKNLKEFLIGIINSKDIKYKEFDSGLREFYVKQVKINKELFLLSDLINYCHKYLCMADNAVSIDDLLYIIKQIDMVYTKCFNVEKNEYYRNIPANKRRGKLCCIGDDGSFAFYIKNELLVNNYQKVLFLRLLKSKTIQAFIIKNFKKENHEITCIQFRPGMAYGKFYKLINIGKKGYGGFGFVTIDNNRIVYRSPSPHGIGSYIKFIMNRRLALYVGKKYGRKMYTDREAEKKIKKDPTPYDNRNCNQKHKFIFPNPYYVMTHEPDTTYEFDNINDSRISPIFFEILSEQVAKLSSKCVSLYSGKFFFNNCFMKDKYNIDDVYRSLASKAKMAKSAIYNNYETVECKVNIKVLKDKNIREGIYESIENTLDDFYFYENNLKNKCKDKSNSDILSLIPEKYKIEVYKIGFAINQLRSLNSSLLYYCGVKYRPRNKFIEFIDHLEELYDNLMDIYKYYFSFKPEMNPFTLINENGNNQLVINFPFFYFMYKNGKEKQLTYRSIKLDVSYDEVSSICKRYNKKIDYTIYSNKKLRQEMTRFLKDKLSNNQSTYFYSKLTHGDQSLR